MVNNSDYLPMIHSGMIEFNEKMKSNIDRFNENLDSLIAEQKKRFTFKHEPQIELPFDAEYKNIVDKINKDYGEKYYHRERLTHAFLSGYLPSGASIRFRPENYQAIFINGTEIDSGVDEYVCRAEEGGAEKLNVLVFMPFKGQGIEYADIPLCEFKMLLHDDEKSPDIRSFIESGEIDTLKYVGDMTWTSSEVCTLRRLEITEDIYVTGNMRCICLRDLIIPNVTSVPDVSGFPKASIVKLDVTNAMKIDSLSHVNPQNDLIFKKAISINGFEYACEGRLINTGNSCNYLQLRHCSADELICGMGLTEIGTYGLADMPFLKRVTFNNKNLLSFARKSMSGQRNCTTVIFSSFSMSGDPWEGESNKVLFNLEFQAPITNACIFGNLQALTEQSCLNIINALDPDSAVRVSLHTTVKFNMQSVWYCKPDGDNYIFCTADDEGAITQAEALLARGGTLA